MASDDDVVQQRSVFSPPMPPQHEKGSDNNAVVSTMGVSSPSESNCEWVHGSTGPNVEEEIPVHVRLNLFRLSDIDGVRSTAYINAELIFEWEDPRLRGWKSHMLPGEFWGCI